MTEPMIVIEVQLEPSGDPVAYFSPEMVDFGDRVLVSRHGLLTVGYVTGIGSRNEPEGQIVRALGPLEQADDVLRGE